jgi:uncharacterized protein involved in exopolysaccharide biosynthesis
MAQNLREQIADNIQRVLKDMRDPLPVLVTREPFEVTEIAITQFPALLITPTNELRETISMGAPGAGRRQGTISFTIRGFVRGVELDRKRNDLIERIEEELEGDRYRGLRVEGVLDSQITSIEIIERQPPLAEFVITFEVRYNYLRSST